MNNDDILLSKLTYLSGVTRERWLCLKLEKEGKLYLQSSSTDRKKDRTWINFRYVKLSDIDLFYYLLFQYIPCLHRIL